RGAPVLARFYELRTNKPLYITKGTMIRVKGVPALIRPDEYEVSYSDASVINHYGVLISGADLVNIEAEYKRLAAANPAQIKRPDKLHGLSPLSEGQGARRPRQTLNVKSLIGTLDDRGAWT